MEDILQFWEKIVPTDDIITEILQLLKKVEPLLTELELRKMNAILDEKYEKMMKMQPHNVKRILVDEFKDAYRRISEEPCKSWIIIFEMIDNIEMIISFNEDEQQEVFDNVFSDIIENKSSQRQMQSEPEIPDIKQTVNNNLHEKSETSTIPTAAEIAITKEKAIKKLERKLKYYEKRVETVKNEEVDLDDERKSSYLKFSFYIEKYMDCYKAYCKLTEQNDDFEELVCCSFSSKTRWNLNGITKYPELEKEIEEFLISRPCSAKADNNDAPDYLDILTIVKRVNKNVPLNIPQSDVPNFAIEVFEAVVKVAKNMNRVQLECAVPEILDAVNDPADSDEILAQKLKENQIKSSTGHEVIQSFMEKCSLLADAEENNVFSETTDEEPDEINNLSLSDEQVKDEKVVEDLKLAFASMCL